MRRSIMQPMYDVVTEILPGHTGAVPIVPAPAPDTPTRGVTCEGCGCRLDTKGAILARGEGLKARLDAEDRADKADRKIAEQDTVIANLRSELQTAKSAEKKTGRSFFDRAL